MKSSRNYTYKVLYEDCATQSAGKDRLLSLLEGQVMALDSQQKSLQRTLAEQAFQINEQQELLTRQEQTILGQAEKLSQQQTLLTGQQELITAQQKQLEKSEKALLGLDTLRYELKALKKWIYGIKSEKRHLPEALPQPMAGDQLSLDMEVDSWGVCQVTDRRRVLAHLRVLKTTTPKKRGGRHDFPEGLQEEITVLDVADKPAGARCVGYVDQRQLACDPIRWYIKVNRRLVYLAPKDEEALNYKQWIAPLPSHPIAKCKMDVSVLVLLTVEKFLYHLPVWRQRQRLRAYGIDLPYSTLCYLVNKTCETLKPLWHLLLKEITHSGLMHLDETRYRVLDETKKKGKKSHIGWMWACLNPVQGITCFIYQPGRSKKDIRGVLQGYKGFLMTDAYGAYKKFGRQPGVVHQHCLSHARRYFLYAQDSDAKRARYALDQFFGPLYGIEEECRLLELDFDGITQKRQSESLPLLHALRQWLEQELPKTLPRTPIHKAMSYTLHNFSALEKYTSDGMLKADNNILEGQIRSIALGRLNYLFAGSHRGGELAAIIYSFMATCKLQKIDPAKWLDEVLRRLPDHPEEKLIELLPQFYKPLALKNTGSA